MSEGHRRHSIQKLFAWLYVDNWLLNFAAEIPARHKRFFACKNFVNYLSVTRQKSPAIF